MSHRVFLIGEGPSGESALQSLLDVGCDVVGLMRSEGPSDPVMELARSRDIPVHTDVSKSNVETIVTSERPHCTVVSSYTRMLSASLFSICPFLNVHYSPLPRYRGRANINWMTINDEPEVGLTVHIMTEEMDAGNILLQKTARMGPKWTINQVLNQLNEIQREHLGNTVLRFLNGDRGTAQDESEATYGCRRVPEDGLINWQDTSRKIECLMRALLAPYPGAYTFLKGEKLTLLEARVLDPVPRYVGRVPGRVVAVVHAEQAVDVLTGDGVLRLLKVEWRGVPTMAGDLGLTVRDTLGLSNEELLRRIELLEHRLCELQNSRTAQDS